VATCFLISGAAGLVYKVIWMRLIDKLVGGTPSAVATVLAVYMGGLAQGSYLAGRLIDRTARRSICLAAYGVLRSVSV
jgi:spermidine synthase